MKRRPTVDTVSTVLTGRTAADLLYRVLRDEVISLYYQRDRDGLPARLDHAHEAGPSARWAGGSTPIAW